MHLKIFVVGPHKHHHSKAVLYNIFCMEMPKLHELFKERISFFSLLKCKLHWVHVK